MKKIIQLYLWLLLPITILSQQVENITTYKQESTTALAPLISTDAHLFKNSILYDKVIPIAGLRDITNTIETNSTHFIRAWKELYDARTTASDKHLDVDKLNQLIYHYQKQNMIQVGLMNIDFTQFTDVTLADLEEDRTTIQKLANRNRATSTSPYIDKHLFIASPITQGIIETLESTPVNFEIGNIALNQSTQNIKTLQVYHNNTTKIIIDNGILTNPNFSFSFTTTGIKNLRFTATYYNNQQKISDAKVPVKIIYVAQKSNAIMTINATIPFKGYDEPTDCNGNCFGKGEYKVFYGEDNNGVQRANLKKPLIILDGFDPGDIRKIDNGDGSIVDLIDNQGNETNMNKFKKAGFDIVILNFQKYKLGTKTFQFWHPFANRFITVTYDVYRDGGADYIERNANVLKALITKLNGELIANGSNAKLKIIGPSMGGLISRVALTQMEQANQNHNTDIWVSFDSPHQGANIPIGLQYFFNFMELEQVEMLKTPAAKQMLITQVVEPSYATRTTFNNLLNNLGFPQNTRNISLINGSISGSMQGSPQGKMLDLDVKIIGTLLGSLGRYEIETFASHDGGRHKIFERYKRFLFFKNTHTAYLVDNSGRGSLDNAPGGTFDMKNEFESSLGITLPLTNSNAGTAVNSLLDVRDGFARFIVDALVQNILFRTNSSVYLNLLQGSPSFIPTKSSLAFTGANKLWKERLDDRNLVCTGEIPFDTYFAPNNNEEHITLNSTNMAWLIEELKGNQQQPNINLLANEFIYGDSAVCDNKINTYTLDIPNTCSGFTVTWTTSPNIRIIYSTNNSITVVPINGSTDAIGYIDAYIQEKDLHIHRKVWVGVPSQDFLSIVKVCSYEFYANQWTKLQVVHPMPPIELMGNNNSYGLSYQWSVPNSQVRIFDDTSKIDVNPYTTGQLNIGVKMQNQCGCTNFKYQLFNVTQESSGSGGGGHIIRPVD